MKKMPRTLYLSLFLCVIGLIAGLVLGGLNSITAPIIEANKMKEIEKSFAELGVTELTDVDNKLDSVVNAYGAKYDGKNVYVVTTTDSNQFTEVQVIAVVDASNGKILNVKVSGNSVITTHGKDAEFTNTKLGLIGISSAEQMSMIGGATVSSNSVKNCLTKVFEQITALGVEASVPTVAKLVSCEQDLEAVISGNYDLYNAKVNLTSANFTTETVVNLTVSFAGGKQVLTCDQTLNEEEAAAVLKAVKQPSTYFVSCDVANRTYVVDSILSFGGTFTLNVVLNEDNTIASFTATSTNSNPSFTGHYNDYDEQINASIAGAAGQVIGGDAFATVSGATVSSNTFKAGLDLIAKVVTEGGAN